ncbi:MAG: IS200/IS605 family element transposase accessory protein TnpB, partial [Ardenticatenales bacterium]|nr:IS200/IS605 family element transposase accessory protein TnpB [Ardenticatenales bacterium]
MSNMAYRKSSTLCTVHLIHLRLTPEQVAHCERLRREAGRCWSDLVTFHRTARAAHEWPSVREVELFGAAQGYALHSQSIQALAQQLETNLKTATRLRQQELAETGQITTQYPYHTPTFQTLVWKSPALQWQADGSLRLSNGKSAAPLLLRLPDAYHDADMRQVALCWQADHYELALTIDTGREPLPPRTEGQGAGVDLGEVYIAALTAESGETLVINGRGLRSEKRRLNKRLGHLSAKQATKQKGSTRWKKLQRQKDKERAHSRRRQRDILHKASRQAVSFAEAHDVRTLAVGDVRDIQDGVNLGRKSNQKISQWSHGKFEHYLTYKAQQVGIAVESIPEDYSTRTCSVCEHVANSPPRGRLYRCRNPKCRVLLHRDANGSANICSRAVYGCYGKVQVTRITYRRRIQFRRRSAVDTRVPSGR